MTQFKHIMNQTGLGQHYDTKCAIDLIGLGGIASYEIWKDSLENVPKLRTYMTFKTDFGLENFMSLNLSKAERSHMAQLRAGILPLRIRSGRYVHRRTSKRTIVHTL